MITEPKTKEISTRSTHVYIFLTFEGEVLSRFLLQAESPVSSKEKWKPIKVGVLRPEDY